MFNLEYDKILVSMFQKHEKLPKVARFEKVIAESKKSEKDFANYAREYIKHEIYDAEFYGDISKEDAKRLMKLR